MVDIMLFSHLIDVFIALASIISKFKLLKNVGFETFSKLYHSEVIPIMDYCSGIWSYGNLEMCQKIQQHALNGQ